MSNDWLEGVDDQDAIAIGHKVIEMAGRAQNMHAVAPGSVASWAFEMDGQRFSLKLAVEAKV